MRTLFNRARKQCTGDTLDIKLKTLKHTLMPNFYPAGFIKHHRQPPGTIVELSAPKLEIAIRLTLRGRKYNATCV